jgi:hypothetical protein
MSVEGVPGVFCVSGQACVANISNGACPGPQSGLPNGAVSGEVKTGVYGCKPAPPTPAPVVPATKCEGPNSSPMSVEGVPGVFCVTGQACVANISNGACPGPQPGLPNGAACGVVKTGVYGCKPKAAKRHHKKSHSKNVCSGPGQSPMSVEGVEGVFCVTGQACVANIGTGVCPGPQAGLPNGAECGKVKSGVFGCKPKAGGAAAAPQTAAPKTDAKATEAPKTVTPAAATTTKTNTTTVATKNTTTTITTTAANKTVTFSISLDDDSEDSEDASIDLTVDDSEDSEDSVDAAADDSEDSEDSVDAAADDSEDSEDSVDAAADDSEDSEDSEERR